MGGKWVAPLGSDTIDVVSPSTEQTIGRVPAASPADLDRAVAAARQTFDAGEWSSLPPADRASYLGAIADELEVRRDQFAETLASEAGLPRSVWATVDGALSFINYYIELASRYTFDEIRQGLTGKVAVRREPVGVVGAILPWNSPLSLAFMKLAPALVAGCTVVLKPDPQTPLHAFLLAEVLDDVGLPPGVVNLLPAGPAVSEALVRHPDVDKISFTGSTAVGRVIGAICGELLKPCGLELGGKSAAVVLDDVDLGAVLPWLVGSALMNNGEACVLQSRVLAPRSRYDEIAQALGAAASAMRTGDPLDPATNIGPMISARQRDRVEAYVKQGVQEGAKIALGGSRPEGLDHGWYVAPTILVDVDNGMKVAREEIFGPVVSVIPYDTEGEAVALANDSPYGLSGTVWTSDPEKGMAIASRVRTGNYGVNTFGMDPCAPFGGYKQSGVGRELGPEGLEAFLQTKSIHLPPGWSPEA
jgi:aldehyde dehydrogenase (NAD+)